MSSHAALPEHPRAQRRRVVVVPVQAGRAALPSPCTGPALVRQGTPLVRVTTVATAEPGGGRGPGGRPGGGPPPPRRPPPRGGAGGGGGAGGALACLRAFGPAGGGVSAPRPGGGPPGTTCDGFTFARYAWAG